jgi:hypothetical protein
MAATVQAIESMAQPKPIEAMFEEVAQPWEMTAVEYNAAFLGLNGYIGFYKGKRAETYAKTPYHAQQHLAKELKAKHPGEVAVVLAEKGGEPVIHSPADIEDMAGVPITISRQDKEPWQMTRAEFWREGAGGWANEGRETSNYNHKVAVKQALASGWPVSAEVLADYPDLTAKPKPIEAMFEEVVQPWQMTRAEYRQSINSPKLEAIQKAIKEGKPIILRTALKGIRLTKQEHLRMDSEGVLRIPSGKRSIALFDGQVDQLAQQAGIAPVPIGQILYHHSIVEQALSKGKPVPTEVLADYPELMARPKPVEALLPEDMGKQPMEMVGFELAEPKVRKPRIVKVPTFSLSELQKKELERTTRSIMADLRKKHSVVVSPGSPKVAKWAKNPGTMDVRGIDTPSKSRIKAMRRKHRQNKLHDATPSVSVVS